MGGDYIRRYAPRKESTVAKKAELLEEASNLKLGVSSKNTIAEIEKAILEARKGEKKTPVDKEIVAERKADVAKAGKRSEKAIHEAEEKADKEARKTTHDTSPQNSASVIKRGPSPTVRPKSERHGKRYKDMSKKVEAGKLYSLAEAIQLVAETSPVKFDATIEIHAVLGVDPRQADQNIRSSVTLPHGTGKNVRVAAFVPSDEVDVAKNAGADIIGEEAIIKQLDKEQLNFDVLVSTPQLMPKLGKYARLLGPRGLMPNPKSGTVATNVAKAVHDAKSGKVEYRVDKQSIVHLGIGKVSFGAVKLLDNAKTFIDNLQSVKPTSIKGTYILTVHTSSTMGPGIKIDTTTL